MLQLKRSCQAESQASADPTSLKRFIPEDNSSYTDEDMADDGEAVERGKATRGMISSKVPLLGLVELATPP